jgi:hypothetical protein
MKTPNREGERKNQVVVGFPINTTTSCSPEFFAIDKEPDHYEIPSCLRNLLGT